MAAFASLHATFRIITPMFLGDVERRASRFSIAGFKGALRFWWRARAYPRLLQEHGSETRALAALAKRETRLFGNAAKGDVGGQSLVRLVLIDASFGTPIEAGCVLNETGTGISTDKSPNPRRDVIGKGARYLGYGVVNAFTIWKDAQGNYVTDAHGQRVPRCKGGELLRSCFPADGHFTIALAVKPLTRKVGESEADFDERTRRLYAEVGDVSSTLKLLGLIGGLGARTRRGWGSLALVELTGAINGREIKPWAPPVTEDAYRDSLRELLSLPFSAATASMPFTAFSTTSRAEIVKRGTHALPLLSEIGDAFLRYRGWCHPAGEGNFKSDHDGFKVNKGCWSVPAGALDGSCPAKPTAHPLRVAFGLPHNYPPWLKIEGEQHDRRASPLFFHIHPLGDGFAAIITFLPAIFLPKIQEHREIRSEKIRIVHVDKAKKETSTLVYENVDNGVVERFLDGFTDAGGRLHTYFSRHERKVVLP